METEVTPMGGQQRLDPITSVPSMSAFQQSPASAVDVLGVPGLNLQRAVTLDPLDAPPSLSKREDAPLKSNRVVLGRHKPLL